jgi:Terminase RNaseH-like domain
MSGFPPQRRADRGQASGTQLIQELIADGLYAVTRYQPQSDKIKRMHAQTAMIENGFVHLPDAAPWFGQYLHEVTTFPSGRHDDQVDSTAQLHDWFKRGSGPSSNGGIFELYRQEAEEIRRQQAHRNRRIRLRVPQGIGHRNLLLLNVAADGTCRCWRARPSRSCGPGGNGSAPATHPPNRAATRRPRAPNRYR